MYDRKIFVEPLGDSPGNHGPRSGDVQVAVYVQESIFEPKQVGADPNAMTHPRFRALHSCR